MLFKIFIDYQELFYQAFSNNIFFWNLYQQSILVVFRCSGTTDNLIRIEQGKNVICFDRIILMLLVNNYGKSQTVVNCILNMFDKVCALTILKRIVPFLSKLFPVDETGIIFFKARRHYIG